MSDPVSLAPDDVVKTVEKNNEAERIKQIALAEKSNKLDEERELLQKYVYSSANPSPVVIAIIVLSAFLVIYVIYLVFVKPCLSGEWSDIRGNVWIINHNILTGNLCVRTDAGELDGKVSDNFVEVGELTGVWNYGNTVIFVDGPTIERII